MVTSDLKKLLHTMEQKYVELPPRLRKALRFVVNDPTSVALSPLRRLAEGAGVSPTTLIRLANAFGFSTYDDFRAQFRDSIYLGSQRYSGAATKLVDRKLSGGHSSFFLRSGEVLADQIRSTFSELSPDEIRKACQALLSARNIYILGLRSCFSAAFYFHYVCRTFKSNVTLLQGHYGMMPDEMMNIDPSDALVALSYDPYSSETVRITELFAKAGSKIVAITDNRLSPIARRANHTLIVSAASSSFYTTLVPSMALLEAMISYMLIETGQQAVDQIRDRFARIDALGVFWDEEMDGSINSSSE